MLAFHIKKQQPHFYVCFLIPPCEGPNNEVMVTLLKQQHWAILEQLSQAKHFLFSRPKLMSVSHHPGKCIPAIYKA